MLWTMGELPGYEVEARDGPVGHVRDVYFSDETWRVRYLVVERGRWPHHQQVLIPPEAVEMRDGRGRSLRLAMSAAEVGAAPLAETSPPISRQLAMRYRNFVVWPALWLSAYAVSPDSGGAWPMPNIWREREEEPSGDGTRHLRSAAAIVGHHVLATDRPVGRVDDFALTDDWRIEDLVVDSGSWRHHERVLVAPYWVVRVSWAMSSVLLSVSSDAVFRIAGQRPTGTARPNVPSSA